MVAVHVTGESRITGQTAALGGGVTQTRTVGVVATIVDGLRVRETDLRVEATRTEFLELPWLAWTNERLVRLAAVERIGLQPFFAAGDAIRVGDRLDLVQPTWQVGNHGLTCQRRHCDVIRLVLRTRDDHRRDVIARGAFGWIGDIRGDWAGIRVGKWINRARQRIRQRLVKHVIGHLTDVVAQLTGLIEQDDLEVRQARLFIGENIHAAAGIVFAVQREVIFIDQHRDIGWRERRLDHRQRDRRRDRQAM